MLLRTRIGFTWRCAVSWREPESAEESLELAASRELMHDVLDAALPAIETGRPFGTPSPFRLCY